MWRVRAICDQRISERFFKPSHFWPKDFQAVFEPSHFWAKDLWVVINIHLQLTVASDEKSGLTSCLLVTKTLNPILDVSMWLSSTIWRPCFFPNPTTFNIGLTRFFLSWFSLKFCLILICFAKYEVHELFTNESLVLKCWLCGKVQLP